MKELICYSPTDDVTLLDHDLLTFWNNQILYYELTILKKKESMMVNINSQHTI